MSGLQIEEGKWYRRRDGQIVGPAERSGHPDYPWLVGNASHRNDGFRHDPADPDDLDLIEEVPAPGTAETAPTAFGPIKQYATAPAAEVDPNGEFERAYAEAAGVDIKATIADEAKRIVTGARRSAYGKPENNFERIARFWQAYFANTGRDVAITAADVSPLMRLMKEARLCETPDHKDSFVDIVGYALTGAEVNGVS